MSSIPAPELNNADWKTRLNRVKAAEFGYLRLANAVLLVVSVVALGTLGFVGYQLREASLAMTNFKPWIVRVNDVGKAEVVYYHDFSRAPHQAEVVRSLSDFTMHYYTRMKGRVEAYWDAKYLLTQEDQAKTYQVDQLSGWTTKIERGVGLANDVVVNRVTPVSLTEKGGIAYVDFDRIYYQDGQPTGRKESDTVTYRFTFADKIEGAMLLKNPLGIVLTDIAMTENFH